MNKVINKVMENPRPEKVAVVTEVREKLASADAAFITEYRGLSVASLASLRRTLRQSGADSVLVVRLLDSATSPQHARATSPAFTGSAAETYSFFDLGSDASWNSLQTDVFIESSLYELTSRERLWSGVSHTVLKENTDSVAKIEPLAKNLFALMRQDGVIH